MVPLLLGHVNTAPVDAKKLPTLDAIVAVLWIGDIDDSEGPLDIDPVTEEVVVVPRLEEGDSETSVELDTEEIVRAV